MGKTLEDRDEQGFLNGALLTQGIKAAVDIEKLSAQQKKQLIKRHPTEQEKTFVSSPSYRGLKARIFQKFRKQTTRNQTAQSTNRLMKLTNSSQKRKYKCLLNMKGGESLLHWLPEKLHQHCVESPSSPSQNGFH